MPSGAREIVLESAGPAQAEVAQPRWSRPDGIPSVDTLPTDGSGVAMPEEVRAKMERAFAVDFSAVRIHEGPRAEALGALAYTQGAEIHFAAGQYEPGSPRGQELLGHELAHVVQQTAGRVGATKQVMGVALNDDETLEAEADRLGAASARNEECAFTSPGDAVARGPALSSGLASPSVQRSSRAVIQRAILAHGNSNSELKALYDDLCQQTPSVGALTDLIGQPITIRYGGDDELQGRHACFYADSRTIVIQQAMSRCDLAEIRRYILVELNHARTAGLPPMALGANPFAGAAGTQLVSSALHDVMTA